MMNMNQGETKRAAQEGDLPPLLTDERIAACIDEANRNFNGRKQGPSGQQMTTYDDWNYWLARTIESEVRTAIAAAGGGVPQLWVDELRIAMEHSAWDGALQLSDALANIDDAMQRLASSPQPEAAQSPAEKERDAIAELNHQQWLALGQCAALVSACHRLSAESEEYDFDDGLGRGAQQAYWDEFDSALERASEALDQANKETQRIHATQFAQPAQPEAAPAVAQVPPLTEAQIKRHSMLAADCPSASAVILVSSLRRLLAAAPEAPAVAQMSLADAARHFPNGPFGQPRIAAPEAPAQANNLTAELQQRCSDWGVYWRAPDAHGVILTVDQATELLRDALGVEVEVKTPAQAAQSAGEVEREARPIYELPSVERDEAIRAFEAAHGVRFAADLPSDRAWVEGYAHARAALSHKEPQR